MASSLRISLSVNALFIAKTFHITSDKFKGSAGWVENFKHRHDIRRGERLQANKMLPPDCTIHQSHSSSVPTTPVLMTYDRRVSQSSNRFLRTSSTPMIVFWLRPLISQKPCVLTYHTHPISPRVSRWLILSSKRKDPIIHSLILSKYERVGETRSCVQSWTPAGE
jgi:hypothetical protein